VVSRVEVVELWPLVVLGEDGAGVEEDSEGIVNASSLLTYA
jgi:hypothetical protein